jgi:hypothetical protein
VTYKLSIGRATVNTNIPLFIRLTSAQHPPRPSHLTAYRIYKKLLAGNEHYFCVARSKLSPYLNQRISHHGGLSMRSKTLSLAVRQLTLVGFALGVQLIALPAHASFSALAQVKSTPALAEPIGSHKAARCATHSACREVVAEALTRLGARVIKRSGETIDDLIDVIYELINKPDHFPVSQLIHASEHEFDRCGILDPSAR